MFLAQKVAIFFGMSQSFVVHLRKDIGSEIERQRGRQSKLLFTNQEKRCCVTLITKGLLETTS